MDDLSPPIPTWIVSVTTMLAGWGLTFGLAWLLHPVLEPSAESVLQPVDVIGHLSALISVTFLAFALLAFMIGAHGGHLWRDWKIVTSALVFLGLVAWWLYFSGHPADPETVCGVGGALLMNYFWERSKRERRLHAVKHGAQSPS